MFPHKGLAHALAVMIVAAASSALLPTPAAASQLSFPLAMSHGDVSIRPSADGARVSVDVRGYFPLTDAGLPALPYRVVNVVLPQGETVASFALDVASEYTLDGGVIPASAPAFVDDRGRTAAVDAVAAWSSDGRTFPAQRVRFTGVGYLHGRAVAGFMVFPVRTVDGSLLVTESATLRVETAPADPAVLDGVVKRERFREGFRASVREELASFVINPAAADLYAPEPAAVPEKKSGGFQPTSYPSLEGSPVDYVIITNDSLAASYQVLADWKSAKGVPTVVRTTEWIEANFRNGVDPQETIRNFIVDAYEKWGITYVLLGGDTDQIPVRMGASTILGVKDLPADMYFACLDGDWNADHDNFFGEGGSVDNADLYPEVYLGRLPSPSIARAVAMIDKIERYETPADPSFTNKVLLLGEVLFPSDWTEGQSISLDGADLSEFLVSSGLNDPSLDVARLYENYTAYPGSIQETVATTLDSLEAGFNLVNHVGHGFRFNMSVGNGSVLNEHADVLTNTNRPSNLYLLNCTAVAYTFYCLGEHFLFNPDGGAVSVVGSNESAIPNISQFYMNEYYNVLINQGYHHIGEVFARSRLQRTLVATVGDNLDLYTHYIYSILADPEMSLWTGPVEPLIVTHVPSIATGTSSIQVNVADSGGAVQGALVCLSKGNDDYEVGTTDASGNATFSFTAESAGNVSVVATAQNRERSQTWIGVTAPPAAYIAFSSVTADDDSTGGTLGNGDGVIDAGETIDLHVTVHNNGTAPAANVSLVLRSSSGDVVVTDSTAAVGVVGTDATVAAADPFRVVLSPYVQDGTVVTFTLVAKENGVATWTDRFSKEVHAPRLELVALRIDDTALGNGDGVNQSNETFDLYYEIKNFGTGAAYGLTSTLTDLQDAFVFTDSTSQYPPCPAQGDVENSDGFTIREVNAATEHNLRIDITDVYGRSMYKVFELRPPTPPTTLSFDPSLGPDRLELGWDASASPDVDRYRVYHSLTPGGPYDLDNVDPVKHTVFLARGLQATTIYYFVVTAIDASGNEGQPSSEFAVSTNPGQVEGWPITMPLETVSSPVVGDIDGDQDYEVVQGDSKVYAWHHNGVELVDADNYAQTWGLLSTEGNSYVSHIALADVDAVPGLDIIAASRDTREVYVFNYLGNVLPGWPRPVENLIRAGLVAGDIDGDGVKEIIAIDERGVLYVWHPDGTEWRDGDNNPATSGVFKRTPGSFYLYTAPAIADLDMDGWNEIIIGTQGDSVYVFNEDGTSVPGWPQGFASDISGAIAVGDIDGDGGGDLEIVVAEAGGMNTALHHDGTYLWQRWFANGNSFGPSPALADLTGDGRLETVLPSSNKYLYAVKYNGQDIPGWPVQYSTTTNTESSPIIADMDHDGVLDVILGDETRYIKGWDAYGNLLPGFPLALSDAVRATPTVADLDKDGDVDLIAAGWDKTVYVWDFPKMFDPHMTPWASYHANLYNDGNITTELPTGIQNAAFSYAVSGRGVDLIWEMPGLAGTLFDVYRATSAGRTTGGFERVMSGRMVDGDNRLTVSDRGVEAGVRYVYRIQSVDAEGGEYETPEIYIPVTRAALGQNYPNPFNPVTRIAYWVPEGRAGQVSLVVYDVRGARVRRLVDGSESSGKHVVEWDGRNDRGQAVSSGVYFYRLVQRGFTDTKKMLLVK